MAANLVTLYADQELNSDNWFVITPEGNYFTFGADRYDENSDDTIIIDPKSHKTYNVVFNV